MTISQWMAALFKPHLTFDICIFYNLPTSSHQKRMKGVLVWFKWIACKQTASVGVFFIFFNLITPLCRRDGLFDKLFWEKIRQWEGIGPWGPESRRVGGFFHWPKNMILFVIGWGRGGGTGININHILLYVIFMVYGLLHHGCICISLNFKTWGWRTPQGDTDLNKA